VIKEVKVVKKNIEGSLKNERDKIHWYNVQMLRYINLGSRTMKMFLKPIAFLKQSIYLRFLLDNLSGIMCDRVNERVRSKAKVLGCILQVSASLEVRDGLHSWRTKTRLRLKNNLRKK
jgi:hypothetical protein